MTKKEKLIKVSKNLFSHLNSADDKKKKKAKKAYAKIKKQSLNNKGCRFVIECIKKLAEKAMDDKAMSDESRNTIDWSNE